MNRDNVNQNMFISFKKLNWFEAREYCLSMGADLATPDEHNLQDILEYLRTNDLSMGYNIF